MTQLLKVVLAIGTLLGGFSPMPDRPRLKPEQLLAVSSDVVIGTVVQVYTREKTVGGYRRTLCVSEIAVEEVVKGNAIKTNDRIFARYYHTKWTGGEPRPVGWNGQRGEPTGARIKVYLRGSRSSGFRVVEPNGFAPFPKMAELDKKGIANIQRRFREAYPRESMFVESPEVRRVLVIQSLAMSIEKDIEKLNTKDSDFRTELQSKIDDLDRLDDDKYKQQIETFRKQISEIPVNAGQSKKGVKATQNTG